MDSPLGMEEDMEVEEGSSTTSAKVRALDHETSSHLRKSQIITKVSDIVRELVENGIDADANKISVYLVNAGLEKIEVRDNGQGIEAEDVPLIFRGGHTSKLRDTKNLTRDKYFGFKGEALNAMCAVGRVTLITKMGDENTGRKYKFDFLGRVVSEEKIAHSGGSIVIVESLFGQIPVRRKRLEDNAVSKEQIKDIEAFLKGVALANPKCHISFFDGGYLKWSKASVQTAEQSLIAVLGSNTAKKMSKWGPVQIPTDDDGRDAENINGSGMSTSIELYLPRKPVDMKTMSYTSNKMSMIFCNRKRVYIREFEKLLHRYITAVVEKPQPADQRRFPVSILSITVPPEEADFNREMDKTKVFLVHKRKIAEALEEALMKFYDVDLKNGDQSTPSGIGTSEAGKPTPDDIIELCQQQKDKSAVEGAKSLSGERENAPVLIKSTTASNQSSSRQEVITSFLQNIPSNSSAFANSPTKANNAEGTVVSFPASKPTVEVSALNNPSAEQTPDRAECQQISKIVSNFQLTLVDSQSSQEVEAVVSAPSKNMEVSKPVEAKKSTDEFQGWLDGRIKDNNGRIIENVITGKNSVPAHTSGTANEDYEKFRSILAGPTKWRMSAGSTYSAPTTPAMARINEPPQKKARLDSSLAVNGLPEASPRPFMSVPNTPMNNYKQGTLDSIARWSTPAFCQRASDAVAGVRIPLPSNHSLNNQQSAVPKSVKQPEQLSNWNTTPTPPKFFVPPASFRLDYAPVSRFISEKLPQLRWTPKIIGRVSADPEVGPLYSAQTENKLGIFSPCNMIRRFPEESNLINESLSSLSDVIDKTVEGACFSEEQVSHLFSTFLARRDIHESSFSSEIFHVLKDLSSVVEVYRSMETKRFYRK